MDLSILFRSYAACYLANIIMICPKSSSFGFMPYEGNLLSGTDIFLAFLISESNYLISVSVTAVYRKMKKLSLGMNIAWNIIIFYFFTIAFLILIIHVRIVLYSD